MAPATPPVEKDKQRNGDAEAQLVKSDAGSKADTKQKASANGDKLPGKSAANGDKHPAKGTEAASRQEARGADIPPSNKQQAKQLESNQATSTKTDNDDANKKDKTDDKQNLKKQEKAEEKQNSKKQEKSEEKLNSKKQEKKSTDKEQANEVANKEDSHNSNKEDKLSSNKGDTVSSNKEDNKSAANGGDSTPQVPDNGERRKPDTNYSQSRVKISPYRRGRGEPDPDRSLSLADCSARAHYAGNDSTMNSTMEGVESPAGAAAGAGGSVGRGVGVRAVRGRASYRALPELNLSVRERDATSGAGSRPTAPVVGRKRLTVCGPGTSVPLAKRPRQMQVVGINSDLPLCDLAAAGTELESLKPSTSGSQRDRRCRIM